MVAVPAYAGTVHIGTMRSLVSDVLALVSAGTLVSIYDESGDTELSNARAQMLAHFIASPADDLVMVDNDVMWEPRGLNRLLSHPVDMVAGLYPKRAEPLEFPVRFIDDTHTPETDPETGLIEAEAVPAGFLRITRAAAERMVAAYPETAYWCERRKRQAHDLFGHMRDPRDPQRKLSEDYSFCARWRALGERIWVDPTIQMGHVGPKVFTARLGHYEGANDDGQ